MDFTEYQGLARRTQRPDLNGHQRLDHALFGLCSEVGEIQGLYQKVYQGHSVSVADVADELGDVLWFAGELCDALGLRLEDVAAGNIEKLRKRYPGGFDEERSLHRG